MSKRLFRMAGLVILGSTVVLACILGVAVYTLLDCPTYPETTRTTVPSIPAPPNLIGQSTNRFFPPTPYEGKIHFQTTLTPLEVLTFYEQQLPEEGWEPSKLQRSNMMLFIINKQACPFYGLQFSTQRQDNTTAVEIDPYLNDDCQCD